MLFRNILSGALAGLLLAAAPVVWAQPHAIETSGSLQVLDMLNTDLSVNDSRVKAGGGSLRLLIADPELGLVGWYREGDAVLFFETLPVSVEAPAAEGEAVETLELLAARFVREDGRTLAIAGPTVAPSSWYTSEANGGGEQRLLKASQADGLRMAAVATSALHQHLRGSHYSADADLLKLLAQSASKSLAEGDVVAANELAIDNGAERLAAAKSQWKAHADRSLTLHASRPGLIDVELSGARVEAVLIDEMDEPGELRTEVYARLGTAKGRAVVAQLGGHHDPYAAFGSVLQVPMDWGLQTFLLDDAPDHDDPTEDLLQSVSDSAAVLTAAHLAARIEDSRLPKWAVEAWLDNTVGMREQLLPMRDDATAAGEAQAKSTYTYYNRLYVHDKSLAVIARHSASVIRNYRRTNSSGAVSLRATHNFCNEGTCALSMNQKCGPVTSSNSSTGWRMPPIRTSHVDDPGGGTKHSCGTRYSLAFRSNRHNCHSDTWTQVRAVKGKSHGAFAEKCLEPKEIAAHCNH